MLLFFSDFIEAFKKCFKQSFAMGIIDSVFVIGFSVAIPTYKNWAENNSAMYVPFIICLSCLIVFFMMHFYIYLMIVSTNLRLRQIMKNAFFPRKSGCKEQYLYSSCMDSYCIFCSCADSVFTFYTAVLAFVFYKLCYLFQLLSGHKKARCSALL